MRNEDEIVPYRVSQLPVGPWLVFAPHADDETFGMGGALLCAQEQGIEVHVLIMTDGALGGSAEGLVAARQNEAAAVADILGLASLEFLGEPDRGLKCTEVLSTKLAKIIKEKGVCSVFFPGMFEPHPDHRSTALLVWDALSLIAAEQRPQAIAYEISVQSPINCLIDITSQITQKRRLMNLYQSQTAENNYIEVVEAMNKLRTFSLPPEVKFAEGFYIFTTTQSGGDLQQLMRDRASLLFE